ncbi:hypothetical protein [Tenacibaculum sp. IB213877]|uniref:hypothetical protein n=1 Tax=Tenacibaculum sp. IB213877 TaxID=3097351 RepID=UPI002A5A0977|nr:hypothetical protein [Tenacibaculum sp. IB213877]MDY0780785.1 hypothetical protein [Tenacibaculum sp. IB213877]
MTTQTDIIKDTIYERIAEINDENVLNAIKTLIDNLENQAINQITSKRDLTGYIKEWVKSM